MQEELGSMNALWHLANKLMSEEGLGSEFYPVLVLCLRDRPTFFPLSAGIPPTHILFFFWDHEQKVHLFPVN